MAEVAVTLLFDASVALKLQWPTVLPLLSILLTRLYEGRKPEEMHMNFVTYASADHWPSPIVAKRPLAGPQYISSELRSSDTMKLGIGCSGSGGEYGMSALEGYAAALELLDLFLTGKKDSSHDTILCHIIHVFAAKTDDAVNPRYNLSTAFDHLTWKTLPEELHKRNVNLNLIAFKMDVKLQELHTSLTPVPCQPWFPLTNKEFTLTLSASESWVSGKRPENRPEPNKAEDSNAQRAAGPTGTSAGLAPAPAQTVSPQQFAQMIQQVRSPAFMQKYKSMEETLANARQEAMEFYKKGEPEKAAEVKNKADSMLQAFNKMKQVVMHMEQALARHKKSAAAANDAANAGSSESGIVTQTTVTSAPQVVAQQQQVNPQAGGPTQASATAKTAGNVQANSNIAVQVQKLVQKEGIKGQTLLASGTTQMTQLSKPLPNQVDQASAPIPQRPNPPQTQVVKDQLSWTGMLSWQMPQTGERMEALVNFSCKFPLHPEMWPQKFDLKFSTERIHPMSIKAWMEQTKPSPLGCRVGALPSNSIQPNNPAKFRNLMMLLSEKQIYAVGSWILPSTGIERPTVLLFSLSNADDKLVATVSPVAGFQDLPRTVPGQAPTILSSSAPAASSAPPPAAVPAPPALINTAAPSAPGIPNNPPMPPQMGAIMQNMSNMNPRTQQFLAYVSRLNPDERAKLFATMSRQKQNAMQQQQQQQQQPQQQQQQQQHQQQQQNQPRTQPGPGPSVGIPWLGGQQQQQLHPAAPVMNFNPAGIGSQPPINMSQMQMATNLGLAGGGMGQSVPGGLPAGMDLARVINAMQQQGGFPGMPGPSNQGGQPFS